MTRLGATTSSTNVDPWVRHSDYLAAIGVIAFAPPWQTTIASAAPTSQAIGYGACYLYNGETITNILACVTVAGVGTVPTALKLGLWDSAATPTCLAATTDLAADARWTSVGWKVCALTAPYAVTSSGIYYPVFWINGNFAGTPMQLALGNNNGAAGTAITKRQWGTVKTGATTMVATDTGTYGNTGTNPLLAVS